MDFDKQLQRYRSDRFADADITQSTGLSVRAWRELIKLGAVRTTTAHRGPGRVRLCDATTLKRAAVIAALNRAGLSLAVAGQIAYFWPYHTLLYSVCDPWTTRFPPAGRSASGTHGATGTWRPRRDWFDQAKPAKAEPGVDWSIIIIDRRFVVASYSDRDDDFMIFGDLREEATRFVAWLQFPRRNGFKGGAIGKMAQQLLSDRFIDSVADWEDQAKWMKELKSIGYEHETRRIDDPLYLAAHAAMQSAIVVTRVNVTLALRKSLRRYLGIDSPDPVDITS